MSDKIVVQCPECSSTLGAPSNAAGKRIRCPKCLTVVSVPSEISRTAQGGSKSQTGEKRLSADRGERDQQVKPSERPSEKRVRTTSGRPSVSDSRRQSSNERSKKRKPQEKSSDDADNLFSDPVDACYSSGEYDPYSAPVMPPRQSGRAQQARRNNLPLATQWQRLGGAIIDGVAIGLCTVFSTVAFLILARTTRDLPDLQYFLALASLLSWFGIPLSYHFVLEVMFHRTLGKLINGTKVVAEDGSPPSFLQILGRSLARNIPFDAFSYFSEYPRGWHDTLSGTSVVKIP